MLGKETGGRAEQRGPPPSLGPLRPPPPAAVWYHVRRIMNGLTTVFGLSGGRPFKQPPSGHRGVTAHLQDV